MTDTWMNSQSKATLFFFIVLGSFLRIYHLGFQCVWVDEAYTLDLALKPAIDVFWIALTADFTPPVYYLITHYSLMLPLPEILALRIPSVIFGILLIPTMYLLGREYHGDLTGLLCAGITSILFPMVYYSQYSRAYTLSFLCFAIALYFFIRTSRDPSHGNELGFWIMVAISGWVHLFSLIPLGLLALYLIVNNPYARAGYAAISLALLSPLCIMFWSILSNRGNDVREAFGFTPLMMVLITPGEFYNVLFIWFFVIGGVALWLHKDELRWFLTWVALGAIAAGIYLSHITPFSPKYYLTVSLIGILMVAVGISEIQTQYFPAKFDRGNDPWKWNAAALAIIVVMIFLALQYGDFLNYYTVQKYLCLQG
jgi:mannosyltransferase